MSIAFRQGLTLANMRGDAARILEMFATKSGMPDGTVVAGPLQRSIVLAGVSFSYEPGRPVLSDVNLEVRRGENARRRRTQRLGQDDARRPGAASLRRR